MGVGLFLALSKGTCLTDGVYLCRYVVRIKCRRRAHSVSPLNLDVYIEARLNSRSSSGFFNAADVPRFYSQPPKRPMKCGLSSYRWFPLSSLFKFQIVSTDAPLGVTTSYLPGAAMATYPMSEPGFASHQPESKVSLVCSFLQQD